MTCKDCYHYEACIAWVTGEVELKEILGEEGCEYFKDKSKIIELPCKVGDTVYYFCDVSKNIVPYFIEQIDIQSFDSSSGYYIAFCAFCNSYGEFVDCIEFGLEDIGESVFLTREGAEAKLKEMNEQ